MKLILVLTIILTKVQVIVSFCIPINNHPSSSALFGSKHHARYGNFADALPRLRSKKIQTLADQLNLPSKSEDSTTGADMRRSRIRNLKEAQKSIPIIDYKSPPESTRNWSDEEINTVVKILNLTYGNKKRDDLSDDERVGLINWDKFDEYAIEMIPEYDNEKIKKKVISWILYHRKKMDIRFVLDHWVFDPKGSPKRLYKRLPKKQVDAFSK